RPRARFCPRDQRVTPGHNRPLVQNGSVLRLGAETDRLLVDVQSDIVITRHTGPPDLVSEPAHNGWSRQHFCSTIRRTSLPIHSNNSSSLMASVCRVGHHSF